MIDATPAARVASKSNAGIDTGGPSHRYWILFTSEKESR